MLFLPFMMAETALAEDASAVRRPVLLSSEAVWAELIAEIKAQPGNRELLARESEPYLTGEPVNIVTGKKHVAPSGDPHDYLSIAPYSWPDPKKTDGLPWISRDGHVNPGFYDYDNRKLETLCHAVQRLILYSRVAGSEPHARRAGVLLRAWFIDEKTRMNPNLRYAQFIPGVCDGRAIGIIDTTSLIFLLDAVTHLEFNPDWTPAHLSALQNWVAQYIDWLQRSQFGRQECAQHNNHGTWFDAQIVCFAVFCGKPEIARKQIEKFTRKRIVSQIEPDGSQPAELKRTLSLTYCTYNLLAYACIAKFARDPNSDLWQWRSPDGRNLLTALQWLRPYYAGEKAWQNKQIKPFDYSSAVILLRLAGENTGDAALTSLSRKLEQYPWQRVIFSKAAISGRAAPGTALKKH